MADNTELTTREIQILALIAEGKSNKEIAAKLVISINTVKVHVSNIFQKIEVSSRTEATLYAIENGIVSPALPQGTPGLFDGVTSVEPEPENPAKNNKLLISLLVLITALAVIITIVLINRNDQAPALTNDHSLMVNFSVAERWSAYENLPEARDKIAATSYESKVYAIGGETESGVNDEVYVFSQASPHWETLAKKPTPVSGASAILIGEHIYVPGGATKDGLLSNKLEVFDPRQNEWEERAALPTSLSNYALAEVRGNLFLFGGWDGKQASDGAYKYDPEADKWSELSNLPEALMDIRAVVVENRIVMIGRTSETAETTTTLNYYPDRDLPGETPWVVGTALPTNALATCSFELLGELYVVANNENGTEFFAYDKENEAWLSLGKNESLLSKNSECVVLGSNLFLLGGMNADGSLSDQVMGYKMIYSISLPGVIN